MKAQLLISLIIITVGVFGQNTETIKLDWKQKKGWKVGYEQKEKGISITEYIKKREKIESWSELIAIQKLNIPSESRTPLKTIMDVGFTEAKKNAPEAKLTLIDKKEDVEYPWIEYIVETPRYLNDPNPESQFFHIVHGHSSIFFIWWSVKKDTINKKEISEWSVFFKTAKVMKK